MLYPLICSFCCFDPSSDFAPKNILKKLSGHDGNQPQSNYKQFPGTVVVTGSPVVNHPNHGSSTIQKSHAGEIPPVVVIGTPVKANFAAMTQAGDIMASAPKEENQNGVLAADISSTPHIPSTSSFPPSENNNLIKVRVPPGVEAGSKIRVRVPQGVGEANQSPRYVDAVVPEGNVPQFYVPVPPPSQTTTRQNWHENPVVVAPMMIPFMV